MIRLFGGIQFHLNFVESYQPRTDDSWLIETENVHIPFFSECRRLMSSSHSECNALPIGKRRWKRIRKILGISATSKRYKESETRTFSNVIHLCLKWHTHTHTLSRQGSKSIDFVCFGDFLFSRFLWRRSLRGKCSSRRRRRIGRSRITVQVLLENYSAFYVSSSFRRETEM